MLTCFNVKGGTILLHLSVRSLVVTLIHKERSGQCCFLHQRGVKIPVLPSEGERERLHLSILVNPWEYCSSLPLLEDFGWNYSCCYSRLITSLSLLPCHCLMKAINSVHYCSVCILSCAVVRSDGFDVNDARNTATHLRYITSLRQQQPIKTTHV